MTNESGDVVQCEPNSISIKHGSGGIGGALLARDFGIEVAGPAGKGIFEPIPDLKKAILSCRRRNNCKYT